jgi:hypothetical protein
MPEGLNPYSGQSEFPEENPENAQMVEMEEQDSKSKEFELTPEIEELIMAKVQDIVKYGVAFSRCARFAKRREIKERGREETANRDNEQMEKIKSVLNSGLLGRALTKEYNKTPDKDLKTIWAENVRKNRDAVIHFNIVGRSTGLKEDLGGTGPGGLGLKSFYSGEGSVSVIFDLTGFRDTSASFTSQFPYDDMYHHTEHFKSFPGETHTYRTNSPSEYSGWKRGDAGYLESTAEFGFVAYHRIAPQRFRGLFLDRSRDEESKTWHVQDSEIKRLVQIMTEVYKEHPDQLLPVYDNNGNLLWPKQMSYEEVKAFVEERDKSKTEGQTETQEPEEEIES